MKQEGIGCITSHDQFAIVCLNKDVLYTALVMINRERSEPVRLPLSNRYVLVIYNGANNAVYLLNALVLSLIDLIGWLHTGSSSTGPTVGWVEGYAELFLHVL